MKIIFRKEFFKSFHKLDSKIQEVFNDRSELFKNNPFDIMLNNHQLRGKWSGHRSINITGDYRAIYKELDNNIVAFVAIGSHSQLYR